MPSHLQCHFGDAATILFTNGGLHRRTSIKHPIVKTIFLRIFSYSTSDVDSKIGSVFGARASSMVPHFPPTLRAR